MFTQSATRNTHIFSQLVVLDANKNKKNFKQKPTKTTCSDNLRLRTWVRFVTGGKLADAFYSIPIHRLAPIALEVGHALSIVPYHHAVLPSRVFPVHPSTPVVRLPPPPRDDVARPEKKN